MRVLVDSNILLRAAISPQGPARALLQEIETHENHGIVLSEYIIEEVERVLASPRILKRLSLEAGSIPDFLDGIREVAEIVLPEPSPTIISNANDQPVLDAATTAGVEVICTVDRHFAEQAVRTLCKHHGIEILDDVALLSKIREMTAESSDRWNRKASKLCQLRWIAEEGAAHAHA